jgi:phosphoribosylformylglycinamidine cyclo-ligase
VRALRANADVKALAHVTGGGIVGNLSRVLPDGVRARIDWDAWERPPVFAWLAEQGIEEEEARRVFNMGIGMCAVVSRADATRSLELLSKRGQPAFEIGVIESAPGLTEPEVVLA